jgi:transglutaminase-like putative cysteine protease
MRFRIEHATRYAYSATASASTSLLHLRPRTLPGRQELQEWSLTVHPLPGAASERLDYFGNSEHMVEVRGGHAQLDLVAVSVVQTMTPPVLEALLNESWERFRAPWRASRADEVAAAELALESPLVPQGAEYAQLAAESFLPGRGLYAALQAFNHQLHGLLRYQPGATTISTPVDTVLSQRAGVCQDFAHVMLASLRSLGLAGRYVSGYIETSVPGTGDALVGADASHAWVSVRCGDAGWIDFDPTNDCIAGERHITVAYGRDFSDVSPVKGVVVGGSGQEVTVGVTVQRLPA